MSCEFLEWKLFFDTAKKWNSKNTTTFKIFLDNGYYRVFSLSSSAEDDGAMLQCPPDLRRIRKNKERTKRKKYKNMNAINLSNSNVCEARPSSQWTPILKKVCFYHHHHLSVNWCVRPIHFWLHLFLPFRKKRKKKKKYPHLHDHILFRILITSAHKINEYQLLLIALYFCRN